MKAEQNFSCINIDELVEQIGDKGWKLDYVYLDNKTNRF